jgi:hypothetical protein
VLVVSKAPLTISTDAFSSFSDYRPSKTWTDPDVLGLAQSWYAKCTKEHTCGHDQTGFRPTRLVELVSEQAIRVVPSRAHDLQSKYATFSHCWGKAKTLKLLLSNLSELESGVAVSDLPTSYREALIVCHRFGFRYIWIDSLCIVQDSIDDWKREAATMKDVYGSSALNISAAAAAENSEASFASRDIASIPALEITLNWDDYNKQNYIMVSEDIKDVVDASPLRSRAWVVQEVWLTPRNLSLTANQLWWECGSFEACETFPSGVPSWWLDQVWLKGGWKEEPLDLAWVHGRWNKLVETYTACKLTVATDKMIAFAGIAGRFSEMLAGDEYVAGLWKTRLP